MSGRDGAGVRARAALAVLTLSAVALWAAPASADDEVPDRAALLEECGDGTNVCEFHATGTRLETYAPEEKKTGDIVHCPGDDTLQPFRHQEKITYSTTVSVGGSVKVGVGAEIPGIVSIETSLETELGHSWVESKTYGEGPHILPNYGHVGALWFNAPVYEYEGVYELHFEDKTDGHYIWYIPATVTVPRESGEGVFTTPDRPMEDVELDQCIEDGLSTEEDVEAFKEEENA